MTARSAARAAGELHYFTGTPCKHGHVANRFVGNGECSECGRLRAAQWGRSNADKVAAKNAAYYEARKPEENARARAYKAANRDKIGEYNSAYWTANMDRLRVYNQERNIAFRDRCRDWNRQFHERNPHKNAEYHDRRRALIKQAEGSYTADDVKRIFEDQKSKCAICSKKRKLTVDHIKALSKGGSNWPSNIQGACKSCNSHKKDRDLSEVMRQRGMLL